jgi:hypothetical protein
VRAQEQRTGGQAGDREKTRRTASSSTPAQRLLALQRAAGNAAVSRAVTAERHQHSAGCEHDQQPAIQRRSLVHQVLGSPGRPLDAALGSEMSARFGGVDFSSVRVHTDAVAQRSAAEIGANAYTSRNHVVWDGRDKHTLAHELTHVIQQSQGPVAGTDNGGGLRVSDPSDSYERAAEANATRVMAGPAPVQRAVGPHDGGHNQTYPGLAHGGEGEAFVQRRTETPARIGFEFQQLRSEVYVEEAREDTRDDWADDGFEFESDPFARDSGSGSDSDTREIETDYYGEHWYIVQDGTNLEFVTCPFDGKEELALVMDEIGRVARLLHQQTKQLQRDDPGEAPKFEIGDVHVTVMKPDSTGQPQVNPDVPLDALPRMHQRAAEDEEHFQEFYGVDKKFWRADTTRAEVAVNAEVAGEIRTLPADTLVRTFRMHYEPSAEQLGSVRGMLQAIASAVVHETSFLTGVAKDQPLLLKTNMGKLWKSLVRGDVIGRGIAVDDVVALLGDMHEELTDQQICRNIVRTVMAGRDPVWGSELKPVNIGTPAYPQSGPTGDRKQILVELRRVPILPINQWPSFANMSFKHFIKDTANRYHKDL